ncbi:CsbD family protein [Amycolatopsis anabasis]|uniref:CsbD family protein n=1 Tax=Amycolatopsis anabasis TaxID=1840409 RepID=UPI003CCE186F
MTLLTSVKPLRPVTNPLAALSTHQGGAQPGRREIGRTDMALSDKFENKADDLGGKAKEAAGKVTGDERLEGEGKLDQAKAGVKDAVEKVKDVFKKD